MVSHYRSMSRLKSVYPREKVVDFLKQMHENAIIRIEIRSLSSVQFLSKRGVRTEISYISSYFYKYCDSILEGKKPIIVKDIEKCFRGLMFANVTVIVAKT